MSDKLKKTINVETRFGSGEQPTPAKFNSVTSQLRRGLDKLERAVGDARGTNWPYSADTDTTLCIPWESGAEPRYLDQSSLARLIGPASNLNPRQLVSNEIVEVTPTGVHQFCLRHPVSGVISGTNPVFTDASLVTYVAAGAVLSAGQYHVTALGEVYCVTATAGGTATYTTDPDEYFGGVGYTNSRYNVIPDPNQLNAGAELSFGAEDADGRRTITLPVIEYQQSNDARDAVALSSDDVNFEVQILLPAVLVDNFSAGESIPANFIFLKNATTNEVYEDAEFFYVNSSSIKVGNVSLTSAIGDGDKFYLFTVGTDITTSIDDLRAKSFHSHDRTYGEPYIDIESITGGVKTPGISGAYTLSDLPNNHFPQYLARDGYQAGYDNNLNDRNAMRGHILMGSSTQPAGSKVSLTGDSYRIYFGTTSGPSIYKNAANRLVLDSGSATEEILATSEIIAEDGITVSGEVQVTSTVFLNTGFQATGTAIDPFHVGSNHGAVFAGGGLVSGPFNAGGLTKWEADDDGGLDKYVTTGWQIPRTHTIYFGEKNAEFLGWLMGPPGAGIANGSAQAANIQDVDFWEFTVNMPTYYSDGALVVLAMTVLVKAPGYDRWWTVGSDPSQAFDGTSSTAAQQPEGFCAVAYIDSSTSPDTIVVRINAGGDESTNEFYADDSVVVGNPNADLNGSLEPYLPVDVKIILTMAAPGAIL